ncbi:hypothetical protein KQX54_007258 [Cotesia glomerata]|uniref:Uncharacterized protein n=1 Tax=Cotesia glomerata TaxID=32391 RepID=A0AAV7I4E7_COTGL|nr:hypothetical protein KQX54_007258 [Cotesia glomerata]
MELKLILVLIFAGVCAGNLFLIEECICVFAHQCFTKKPITYNHSRTGFFDRPDPRCENPDNICCHKDDIMQV